MPSYCTVQDVRDEGVPDPPSDAAIQAKIDRASGLIDRITGRWFEPRDLVLRVDGTGGRDLIIGPPIIEVTQVRLIAQDFASASELDVELDALRVYNRHLAGLLDPDDRENPRISWIEFDRRLERLPTSGYDIHSIFSPHRWPEGTQNVEVTGTFGYTDPDGSAEGVTPDLIRWATVLLVIRRFLSAQYAASDDAFDDRNAWRLRRLKTRDQEIEYADPSKLGSSGVGAFTGDPEIDTILASYVRPPALGAA